MAVIERERRRRGYRVLIAAAGLALLLGGCRSAPVHGRERDAGLSGSPGAALPLLPDPGPAASRPLPPSLGDPRRLTPGGFLRVLVDLREQLDANAMLTSQLRRGLTRQQSRAETLAALLAIAERGRAALEPRLESMQAEGTVDYYRFLRYRNRVFVSLAPRGLEALREDPTVAEIIPEYDSLRDKRREAGAIIRTAPEIPAGDSWGVSALGLEELWAQGVDGRGVVVGSLDSGVYGEHVTLRDGRRSERSWYDPRGEKSTPTDTRPHGSQVLACAVGRSFEGRAFGAAPGATWVAALANRFNGYNNVDMALAADWMIVEAQPDVMLGAWGHGKADCDPRDREMLAVARASGIVPVFAAGNDGPDPASGQAPAALGGFAPEGRGVLAVAAVNPRLEVIEASSRGPSPCGERAGFPDLAAPGWDLPVPGSPYDDSLTLASGTSFAVGWVGGVAALVLQLRPELPVPAVEDLLRRTARDLPPAGPDEASGSGLVDPRAAIGAVSRAAGQ